MDYVARSVDPLIARLLGEVPAIMLVGPRAAGKTTTSRRHASTVVQLDREAEAVAFRADPDAALGTLEEPILLDEWQAVPEVLGAVKRAVDAEPRPGRFLLTGSVRAEMEAETWPGTGRLIRVPMYGLSVRESTQRSVGQPFLERIAEGLEVLVPPDPPDLAGYVGLALASGFPQAVLDLAGDARRRWLESYADQVVTRDVMELEPRRDPDRLRRYLEVLALNSAGAPDDRSIFEAAGVNRKTADGYGRLLERLFITETVPAWTSNRLKRLVMLPKRYLVDPGLFSGILHLDVRSVLKDGDLLGRVLDTLVASQIRCELPLAEDRMTLYHLRTEQGRQEIDLLTERAGTDVIGLEVKASAAPSDADALHLGWLRDRLGDRFLGGVVLHTGPRAFQIGDRIVAAPIASLWG